MTPPDSKDEMVQSVHEIRDILVPLNTPIPLAVRLDRLERFVETSRAGRAIFIGALVAIGISAATGIIGLFLKLKGGP